jgi:succinylarginine dihydrolase
MKWLADLGVKQAIMPPHERPSICTLRSFGFTGSDAQILRAAAKEAPDLLAACYSASNMWVANAATVAPGVDTADGRVHLTPANLTSKFHRSIEAAQTTRTLRAIFRDETWFVVNDPIPGGQLIGDEGAANHTRFCTSHDKPGLHFFVYGHQGANESLPQSQNFQSRQAFEASRGVARLNRLDPQAVVFAQQNPAAIDAGVFHNDVISLGNQNIFLYHEQAFVDTEATIQALSRQFALLNNGAELVAIKVPTERVSLTDAVRSYLFNSQLVSLDQGRMTFIAPLDCQAVPSVDAFIQELVAEEQIPISEVRYFDLRESMKNGGGPACLRLRVVLTDDELSVLPPNLFLTETLYTRLNAWIRKHYRDHLTFDDLVDPLLMEESRRALDELTQILGVGSIYSFQQV